MKPLVQLFLVASVVAWIHPSHAWVEYLKPPAGNSPQIRVKTTNGHQTYKCVCDKWQVVSASADLLSMSDSKTVVGLYSLTSGRSGNAKHHGTWTLYNNPADAIESGARVSTVTAKEILSHPIPGSLSESLMQATSHQFQGMNQLISYIQRLNPQGGVPWTNTCQPQQLLKLPFTAEYQFWRQDMVPPTVPQSLHLPSVNPVQSFFAEGEVLYLYNGAAGWEQRYAFAKLYDIPGGDMLGSFYVNAKPHQSGGTYFWELSDPNGVQLVGKPGTPVYVSNSSLPWMTTTVTAHAGSNAYLKNAKAVQMLSTRGGVPVSIDKSKSKSLAKGEPLRAPFTAVFWFFG